VIFELDQPRVLEFKRQVLAEYGAAPRATRVEVPVDLREDWPAALRDAGFDPAQPSAWIAEGLLVYLPATAQDELFAGVAALSAPGSEVAVEDSTPMDGEAFRAARDQERARGEDGTFFTLVYNEQHRPAAQWFGDRGWHATATPLTALLAELGRPVPAPDSEAGSMTSTINLVRAVRAR
jgi:methyltransferase (TIGR00027 family)